MKIDFNKIVTIVVYLNVFIFIAMCVLPMISITVMNKLYYEMNNKMVRGTGNGKDLFIDNIYEQTSYDTDKNEFIVDLLRLPVNNFQYRLPTLELYFVCDSTNLVNNSNVNFIEVNESVNQKVVRMTRRNVYCSNTRFDYFSELDAIVEKNNHNSFWMKLFSSENIYEKSESERLSIMNNINNVVIDSTDDDKHVLSRANRNYKISVANENKSIKLLANSKISFNYNINDEIFIKKIIAKHSVIFKVFIFIGVYNFMFVMILLNIQVLRSLLI